MTEQVTFQLRRGNSTGATGWTTVNPVLSQGEPGFEVDTTTLKIGDGSTNWNNLNTLKFGSRVAVGRDTGVTQAANTIILNATGNVVTGVSGQTSSCYIAPIRATTSGGSGPLVYNATTNEVTYNTAATLAVNVPVNSVLFSPSGSGISGTADFQYSSSGITLNKLNIQGGNTIAIGDRCGTISQNIKALAIGFQAGENIQGGNTIAIGDQAGRIEQAGSAVAIGYRAGATYQGGSAVAIGYEAGRIEQGGSAVAIGRAAGDSYQKENGIAIGFQAGQINQGIGSIAMGFQTGYTGQGQYSIAIGYQAAQTNQHANTTVLNASGGIVNTTQASAFYVKPIRTDTTQTNPLCYNSTSGEIVVGSSRTTTGTWTLPIGSSTQSITVPINGTYSIWVRGNIPNGIITYTATVVVTNPNVPAIGSSYAWNYTGGGSALMLTSIPTQIIGTLNQISTDVPNTIPIPTNVFEFVISNTSGTSQTVYWGFTTL